jgi:two-component system nitrate/nitrite response regulator NarL
VPIRILLVDDHPIVVHGLTQLLEVHEEFEVVGSCDRGEDVVAAVQQHAPDLVLLDLQLRGIDGLHVLSDVKRTAPGVRVVLLTACIEHGQVIAAIDLGVDGVILKDEAPCILLECLRKVYDGRRWLQPEVVADAFETVRAQQKQTQHAAALLTSRELDVVRMIGLGLRNRDVAKRLEVAEGTVKIHLHHIYEKLALDGRVELILYAQETGLI